jgi:N-acylneuraminate cytidylyltransferase/CMP-N,N'-diacetyllegionaminic acid synthase
MSILGVIPARGGSRGIKNKNSKDLLGKPLIAHTIEVGKESGVFDRLIVTTDSPALRALAVDHGAEVPFLRPPELAQDETPAIDPILHALTWLEQHDGYLPTFVMMLQPTSPLRLASDIQGAVALMEDRCPDSVVSVCEATHHPFWMKRITHEGALVDFMEASDRPLRRQDLPPVFALNGAIFFTRTEVLFSHRSFYGPTTLPLIMPRERSVDVDDPSDLRLAALLLKDLEDDAV